MADKSIICSAVEVRAILDGRQTMLFRRVQKEKLKTISAWNCDYELGHVGLYNGWPCRIVRSKGETCWDRGDLMPQPLACPYGQGPGDRLWVKETYTDMWLGAAMHGCKGPEVYKATDAGLVDPKLKWTTPSHMPREASRLLLDIVAIKAVNLHNVLKADAVAAGFKDTALSALWWFKDVWIREHGEESWEANPTLWAIRFKATVPPFTSKFSQIINQCARDQKYREEKQANERFGDITNSPDGEGNQSL